jgi:choline dehydrogenase-like flavoprotein
MAVTIQSGGATEFDYIVVGGGTAGCVVANRLSANPQHRVLLLEAGGDDKNRWLHIPIGYARVFGKPEFNWIYQVQPEPQLNNRAGPFYQGKVIGGSSAVNGMIYLRGQREDFDHWVRLGCSGWDYDTTLWAGRWPSRTRPNRTGWWMPSSMPPSRPASRATRISMANARKGPVTTRP